MARVSSHPAILSIYGAGVSADGHPFLVMEYCPPPQLGAIPVSYTHLTLPTILLV